MNECYISLIYTILMLAEKSLKLNTSVNEITFYPVIYNNGMV